jgi:hypothetical protein
LPFSFDPPRPQERAKKELLRREIEELERSKEAVVSKVRDFFDKIQSDPRLAKASAGSSPDALIAKNPEFQKCVKRIDELQSELDKLMLWGATSLSAREGSSEAAKELARELKQRPVLVLPDGVLGEHLATAAKEERFLSKEELKEIEADLPFAGREWKQTEEGARLRKIMANMLREFEGTIVEAARDRVGPYIHTYIHTYIHKYILSIGRCSMFFLPVVGPRASSTHPLQRRLPSIAR